MNFRDFSGLGALPGRLQADFSGEQNVHAYLFVGPGGTGKAEMAAICARALNCAGAQKPCDRCPSCLRALSGGHPDLIDVRPAEGKSSIAVDEVRALIARVMVRPFEGGRHGVIIHRADAMTPQAQNALLKTLESAPRSAVFFLLAASTAKLLPTVLSRCRIVRFHPIDEGTCAEVLAARGVEPGRAALLAHAAAGSVGRALALNEDGEYWQLRERVLSALSQLGAPDGVSAASAVLKEDKDGARDILDIIESLGRSLMARDEGFAADPAIRDIRLRGDRLLAAALHARERQASNVVWINLIENLFMEVSR